ncbi:MAG: ABC transporter ATP-binding protein [Nocardioidaceae bacterium]
MTSRQDTARTPLLRVEGLDVRYGEAVTALTGVSIEVPRGGVVAVLGSNGAGKTTLLRAVSGVLDRHLGHVVGGGIQFGGASIDRHAADRRVKAGIVQVPEGRRVFGELTVEENLRVGRFGRRQRRAGGEGLDRVYSLFPVLANRRSQHAGLLSGGEQQMLAIGRGLMSSPTLLMLDEPSLGLAPRIIERIVELLKEVHQQGTAMLLVEQNASVALDLAEHAYVLSVGRVALAGPAAELRQSDDVRRLYLGEIEESSARGAPAHPGEGEHHDT